MSTERYGRDETAHNPNLDPEPETDLQPGETPPESNSATASPPAPPPSRPPKNTVVIATLGGVIVLVVLLVFVGYIAGILG